MLSLVGSIITPAIIASIFALLFNARAEKRRELRTELGAAISESRQLVANAVLASAKYFSQDAAARTAELESSLWLAERELRFTLSSLVERTDRPLATELEHLREHFDYFIGELTGGNFQQIAAVADLKQVRKIAGVGAELRRSLGRLYYAEMREALNADLLDRMFKYLEIGREYVPLSLRGRDEP